MWLVLYNYNNYENNNSALVLNWHRLDKLYKHSTPFSLSKLPQSSKQFRIHVKLAGTLLFPFQNHCHIILRYWNCTYLTGNAWIVNLHFIFDNLNIMMVDIFGYCCLTHHQKRLQIIWVNYIFARLVFCVGKWVFLFWCSIN